MHRLWRGAILPVLLAGGAVPARAQALPPCQRSNPQVATLTVEGAQPVYVYRGKAKGPVGNGGILCLGDVPVAGPASGQVRWRNGMTFPFRAWQAPRNPSYADLKSPRALKAMTGFAPAGTLGDGDYELMLAGLGTGEAQVDANRRTLVVPLARGRVPRTVSLFAPGEKRPVATVEVPANGFSARFTDLRLRKSGEWKVAVAPGSTIGRFTTGSGEAADGAPDDRVEQALTFACALPRRNGFEAYQRLVDAGASTDDLWKLLAWQMPTVEFSCATPEGG